MTLASAPTSSAATSRRSFAVTRSEWLKKISRVPLNVSDTACREDCAPGTCYVGACPGDKIWSTDGTCGYEHGNRRCAGKWGNCCSKEDRCGTGEDFCATGRCQSGKCAPGSFRRGWRAAPVTYLTGNTTDGTCGAPRVILAMWSMATVATRTVFEACCCRTAVMGGEFHLTLAA
jgi:hypothetical protein